MAGDVQISTEALRVAGTRLTQVAEQFETELNELEAELQSFAEPWGSDDIGQLIAVAYQAVVSIAFECFREVLNEIKESGTDLGGMADRYDAVEQEISDKFMSLFEKIGSG